MNDPLAHLYKATDRELTINNTKTDTLEVEKNLFIIYHGAPYTGSTFNRI